MTIGIVALLVFAVAALLGFSSALGILFDD
jgi:hypothetical protein